MGQINLNQELESYKEIDSESRKEKEVLFNEIRI